MAQSNERDVARPAYGSSFSAGAGARSVQEEGPVWKLDGETLAGLDAIRDRLGLMSRGQALDAVVTAYWRKRGAVHTGASDGDRESEILRRIYGMAQAVPCAPEEVVKSAVAAFSALEAQPRIGAKRWLGEQGKTSAKLLMAGSMK